MHWWCKGIYDIVLCINPHIVSVLRQNCNISFEQLRKRILEYQNIDIDYIIGHYRSEMGLSGLGNRGYFDTFVPYKYQKSQTHLIEQNLSEKHWHFIYGKFIQYFYQHVHALCLMWYVAFKILSLLFKWIINRPFAHLSNYYHIGKFQRLWDKKTAISRK